MPTEAFLQTFVLASITVGGALFVLVAVLPTILPSAIDAAFGLRQQLEKELPGMGISDLDRLKQRKDELQKQVNSIDKIPIAGAIAAASLVAAGLLGLWALSANPLYDSSGTACYPDSTLTLASTGLFIAGLGVGLVFASMFWDLIRLTSSAKHIGALMDLFALRPSPGALPSSGLPTSRDTAKPAEGKPTAIVEYQFTKISEGKKVLRPNDLEIAFSRWFAAGGRVRMSISGTDTVDADVSFFPSEESVDAASIPASSFLLRESRQGIRSWATEIETTTAGLWRFKATRPRTNWFNPTATLEVWEGHPVAAPRT